jgi:serine/threonine-protein kinase
MNPAQEQEVAALLASGHHAEAARVARAAGDGARAAGIYAQIWDFRRAAACAAEAGDELGALRHLLDARAFDEAVALARKLAGEGPARARAAAAILEEKRLHDQAAALLEALGDDARAAELYQRAGQPLDAARLLERLGRLREAGRLLEKAVASVDGPGRAPVLLALGRVLGRVGHHEEATRRLQEAARAPETRTAALRQLVGELAALGLSDASAAAAAELRAADPAATLTALPPPPSSSEPVLGGRYRLLEPLGAGGSGRVFRALDEVTGGEVAVKLLSAAGRGTPAFERFLREALVWQRAAHPHIVRILDFREDLGFFVMELLAAGTLAGALAGGQRLPPARVRRLALDVLGALAHAHDRGVLHRDVKPANIFLDAHGLAKLGDFGVAHLLDLGATQTGALIGTLAYMPPEQITGAAVSASADLYALGVTLFEALTGRLPFLGPDFVAQHLGDAAPAPSTVDAALGGWDALLGALLAKDPAARPASAGDVAGALVRINVGERTVLALPRPLPVPLVAAPAPAAPAPADEPRYLGETPIGRTAISELLRAVDRLLERTVVLERFAPEQPDAATGERLLALAGAAGPHLQRVLAWDRGTRTVVYEAGVGAPLGLVVPPLGPPLGPAARARLLAELADALAPLHARGRAHGAVGPDRVLVDDDGAVTLLAAGLGPAPVGAPADDVAACLALAEAAGGPHIDPAPFTNADALAALAERLRGELASAPSPAG